MRTGGAPLTALSLPEIADRRAAAQADAVAFRFLADGEAETGHLTYAGLAARARALAGRISCMASPGERAVLAYPTGLDFPVAFLACLYAGIIAVPVDVPRRRVDDDRLVSIARSSRASLFLTHSSVRDELLPDLGAPWRRVDALEDQAPRDYGRPLPSPQTIAYLQYTSGSTQAPRGAAISHRALMQQLEYYRTRGGIDWQDLVLVGWLPHTHDFGLVGFLLSALYMGTPLIAMPPAAFLRRPLRWLEAISAYRGSYCGGPNFGYELCASAAARARDIDLSCWRIASLGGDYIASQTLARFEAAFASSGFRNAAWLPAYGLAEAVLCASGRQGAVVKAFDAAALQENRALPVASDDDTALRLVSCGAPMPGQHLRIVDPVTFMPLRDGRVGEIWLTGASLADGYWNDIEATRAQFGAMLTGDDTTRYLRTGDCGFLYGGELFFTGRLKDLIIVRGRNHAPDDIEQTIQSIHAALRPGCGGVVQTSAQQGARLIAIQEIARDEELDAPALLAAIVRVVNERHGLALDVIELIRAGSLPRTHNGKICRRACLAAYEAGALRAVAAWQRASVATASSPMQPILAQLLTELQETLQAPTIAPDQNLFELGLDSLAIHSLLGRLENSFGVDIPVEAVFETPTVAALATYLAARCTFVPPAPASSGASSGADGAEVSMAVVLQELRALRALVAEQTELIRQLSLSAHLPLQASATRPREAFAPIAKLGSAASSNGETVFGLSETQREIKLLPELREGAEALFNILMVLEHEGGLDIVTVRRGLRGLASRHEALRTTFEDGAQRVQSFAEPVLEEVFVENDAARREWLRAERRRAFALDHAPAWRATILHQDATAYFVLTAHHLVLDGSSLSVLARELVAYCAGEETTLAAPMQYRQFCAAAEARRNALDGQAHKDYWREMLGARLADFVPPGDGHRLKSPSYGAAVYTLMLDRAMRGALLRCGAAAKATLFHTLLGIYFVLLHRVSGQERIVIGVDAANRSTGQEESVVGCCNVLLPIVMDFADAALAEAPFVLVRKRVLEALTHRDYTLTMWAQDMRIAPDLTRPFKIAAAMNMQRFPARLGAFTPRFDLENQSLSQSPFALVLDVRDSEDGIRLDFIYNTRLFDAAQIARYGGYYLRLLEAMAQDASADMLALPILSEAETGRLLSLGRATAAPAPSISFLRRFDEQVVATPDAEAVAGDDACLSYRQLQACSQRIAQAIAAQASPGTAVALLGARGATFLASMLAILRAGCIYLPLDPKDPDARLAGQLAQAEAGLLLHDGVYREIAASLRTLCAEGLATLDTDALPEMLPGSTNPPVIPDAQADAPAYLIFTSGTTGAPKAAVVTLGGMLNHLDAKIGALSLSAADVLAQTARQSFDISIWQYFAPLLVGARVHVFGDDVTHDPRALFIETQRRAITVLEIVPSMLRAAIDVLLEPAMRCPLDALRWLISTGEALSAGLCRRWISLYPNVPVMNAYGPTECSDDVTHHVVDWPPAPEVVRVPIGRPIAGAELYVLDRGGHLAPTGAAGELYIGGLCVGLGYRNDCERTQAAFIPDGFTRRAGAHLYRTGDLVRFLDDGTLDYLGRIDQQVKINGVRIEPREIETAIQRDPAVLQSLVKATQDAEGKDRLVAYVVFRNSMRSSEGALKAAARKTLPPSLIPSAFVFLDAMPMTANGKIDVLSLPEPELPARSFGEAPPSNAVEAAMLEIWSATIGSQACFGVHDDFFELGGCSLEATVITKRIQDRFGIRIPVSAIFRAPTIAGLSAIVASLSTRADGSQPAAREGEAP